MLGATLQAIGLLFSVAREQAWCLWPVPEQWSFRHGKRPLQVPLPHHIRIGREKTLIVVQTLTFLYLEYLGA